MNPVSHKESGFLFVWGCQGVDNAEIFDWKGDSRGLDRVVCLSYGFGHSDEKER